MHGLSGIASFADANQHFLLNINTSAVRALFSQPAGDRAYDPNLAFLANERTYAFYGSPSSGSPSPDW